MIVWNGHASVSLIAGAKVCIDPAFIKKDASPADIICITHANEHHLSRPDLERLAAAHTLFLAPDDCLPLLQGLPGTFVRAWPGNVFEHAGVSVRAVPTSAGEGFGYLVTIGGKTVYHAGDTGLFNDMSDIRCDFALLPVAGASAMGPQEAADCVDLMRPQLAIPIHYGTVCGTVNDANEFCRRCAAFGIAAKMLTPP